MAELGGPAPEPQTKAEQVNLRKRPRKVQKVEEDRLPPHSVEMESGVIGCVLQNPNCLGDVIELLKSDVTVFYDLRHQRIYAELLKMSDDSTPVDIITLQQKLKERGVLEEIGGIPFLSSIQDSVHSAANISYYADVVIENALRRRLISSCTELVQKAYGSSSVNELVGDVEKALQFQNEHKKVEALDGSAAGERMIGDLDRRLQLEGRLSGLDTGLVDLNAMTEGLQFGEQFILGARPSQGKTALGLSIFKHCAFNGVPSLFVSLEMSVESIMRRLLSMHMSIPLRTIRRGSYNPSDFGKFASFKGICKKHPMHIVDAVSGLGIRDLSSLIRRKVVQHGIKLVVIDYMQKIKPAEKQEKRTYEIGEISGRLKALAVEHNVAMVTLAQLNRDNMKDKGRLPRLSDLADSGQIERDADTVGLLHKGQEKTQLLIAKQRDGETGMIDLFFDGEFVRFENMKWSPED